MLIVGPAVPYTNYLSTPPFNKPYLSTLFVITEGAKELIIANSRREKQMVLMLMFIYAGSAIHI